MKPKSHTLFHFTKNADTLKKIILEGFWPRYCLEDVSWFGVSNFDYIAYPMVSFCDIPLARIDEHVCFYGEYGIGLTKEWAISNSLNPILYISHASHLQQSILETAAHINQDRYNEEDRLNGLATFRYVYAFVKPIEGHMLIGAEFIPKEFYQESEWRFIPKIDGKNPYLLRKDYEDDGIREQNNQTSKVNYSLKFTPRDIKYIFVKSDSDIPSIINFIQTELDCFPAADLKILMSRVTSLESIQRDL